MYSAPLRKEDLLELKREIKQTIMSEMEEAAFKKRDKDEISGQMTLEMTDVKTTATSYYPEESDGTDSLYIKGHKLKKSDGKSTFCAGRLCGTDQPDAGEMQRPAVVHEAGL